MSEAVLAALITGGLSLAGVIVSNVLAARKTESAMKINQAVTDTKLDVLTREVREHNNFARRMPVVENEVMDLQRRVTALEAYHKQPVN